MVYSMNGSIYSVLCIVPRTDWVSQRGHHPRILIAAAATNVGANLASVGPAQLILLALHAYDPYMVSQNDN